jgi:hypothetical protein
VNDFGEMLEDMEFSYEIASGGVSHIAKLLCCLTNAASDYRITVALSNRQ